MVENELVLLTMGRMLISDLYTFAADTYLSACKSHLLLQQLLQAVAGSCYTTVNRLISAAVIVLISEAKQPFA